MFFCVPQNALTELSSNLFLLDLVFGLATLWYTSRVAPLAGYSRLILPINLTIQPNRATFC